MTWIIGLKVFENKSQVIFRRLPVNSFKEKKIVLFTWINAGNVLERCSQPGPSFGKFSGVENCPITAVEPVLNRLLRDGQLDFETFYDFGIRWERFVPKISENIPGEKL